MKHQIKLLGIDDGPFLKNDKKAILIGAIVRATGYLEGVLKREVLIDGTEATETIIQMIQSTRHKPQIKTLLLDGVAVGGFNVINIKTIFEETLIPVITITRDLPDFDKIKKALQSHFSDWKQRYEIIQKGKIHTIQTQYNPLCVKCVGFDVEKAKEIITLSTIRGVIPEPIRMAHIIASGVVRGDSYGKT